MDILIVRTRLQALIALKLIEMRIIKKGFCLIRLSQHKEFEDHQSVYDLYDKIANYAAKELSFTSSNGVNVVTIRMIILCLISAVRGGKIYAASIDWTPLALATRIVNCVELNTFDDGSANLLTSSKYFTTKALPRSGFRRALVRMILPNGSSLYMRSRTERHYTIFRALTNIVEEARLHILDWDWLDYITDRDIAKIPHGVRKVFIGSVYDRYTTAARKRVMDIANECDLYIPHPRDMASEVKPRCAITFDAPAEAILEYLGCKSRVEVFHLGSTVALSILRNRHNVIFSKISINT